MIELNNTIKWKPESTGSGRFGKWLENLVDWNLSQITLLGYSPADLDDRRPHRKKYASGQ